MNSVVGIQTFFTRLRDLDGTIDSQLANHILMNCPNLTLRLFESGLIHNIIYSADIFDKVTFLLGNQPRYGLAKRLTFIAAMRRLPEAAQKYLNFYETSLHTRDLREVLKCIPVNEKSDLVTRYILNVCQAIERQHEECKFVEWTVNEALNHDLPNDYFIHPDNRELRSHIIGKLREMYEQKFGSGSFKYRIP